MQATFNKILGLILLISILANLYQFNEKQIIKNMERSAAKKHFQLISTSLLTMSYSLENIVRFASNTDGNMESEDQYKLFSSWNGIYSSSKELEFKAGTINTIYNKSIGSEIINTQQILSIVNKNLYNLNLEFLNKNPQNFVLTAEEKETLKTIAEICRLLGNGINTDPDISFKPGVFEELVEFLKKIDDTGWCRLSSKKRSHIGNIQD